MIFIFLTYYEERSDELDELHNNIAPSVARCMDEMGDKLWNSLKSSTRWWDVSRCELSHLVVGAHNPKGWEDLEKDVVTCPIFIGNPSCEKL